MARYPDKYFELAIIDPPYGIGEDASRGGKQYGKAATMSKAYTVKRWDDYSPDKKYFDELIRISKNQIIWGANHFISKIPFDSSCWIVWDKVNGLNDFADSELAWTSFKTSVRNFRFQWNGMLQGNMKNKETRIHPTQKPVALYKWLLSNYAKDDDKILDTHLGSGSSRISANRYKLDFVGCEIDEEYFNKQNRRYADFISQMRLF